MKMKLPTLLKLTGMTMAAMILFSCEDKKAEELDEAKKQFVEDHVSTLKEARRMREDAREKRAKIREQAKTAADDTLN